MTAPCRHRHEEQCLLVGTFCPATISPDDSPIIILDEDELDCYEPQDMTASDVLAGGLIGLLIVAGTAIMLLFALSRGPWL